MRLKFRPLKKRLKLAYRQAFRPNKLVFTTNLTYKASFFLVVVFFLLDVSFCEVWSTSSSLKAPLSYDVPSSQDSSSFLFPCLRFSLRAFSSSSSALLANCTLSLSFCALPALENYPGGYRVSLHYTKFGGRTFVVLQHC